MSVASTYTHDLEFVGWPAITQVGIVRLGGFWRVIPPSDIGTGYTLYARYVDTTEADLSMYQRGVARGASVTAPITFALVATVMRVIGPLQSGGVDVTLWQETTRGREIGFGLPKRVWDLGQMEYVVGVRLEVVGGTVLRPGDDFGVRDPTDGVGYDWMPWTVGRVTVRA